MPYFKSQTQNKLQVHSLLSRLERNRLSCNLKNIVHGVLKTGTEMTTNNVTIPLQIFNSLRIPDAVKDLPNFDGNPRLLYDFLSNVEEILSFMPQLNDSAYHKIILRAIRNKITGQANEVLNMYGTPVNWNEIKRNLIVHYSDKRNETSLIRDLHQLRQNYDTVDMFYSKIIDLLSAMVNHVKVHESEPSVIFSKQKLYEEMCLNTFLSGLREPLGSTVRSMRPITLTDALNFCLKEQNCIYFRDINNLNYLQNRNQNRDRQQYYPQNSITPFVRQYTSNNNPQAYNVPTNNRQQNYTTTYHSPNNQQLLNSQLTLNNNVQTQSKPNTINSQATQFNRPSTSAQSIPFQSNTNSKKSYSNQSKFSRPQQYSTQTKLSRSEPMDVVSSNTNLSRANPNSQNYLHNIEFNDNYEDRCLTQSQNDTNYFDYTEPQPYLQNFESSNHSQEIIQSEIDDTNFLTLASENQ